MCQTKILNFFGLDEATAAGVLSDFENAVEGIRLDLEANFPEIRVVLHASGDKPEQLEKALEEAAQWVAGRTGNHLFSSQGESMAEAVGRSLRRQNATLAVAESCTGGLISSLLTDVPGSSDYFLFGGITYSNQSKMSILSVAAATIQAVGAVHEETAKEMAAGVRRVSGATYGISTSGIAGPEGGSAEKPVGTVCIGIATPKAVHGYRYCFANAGRHMNKYLFAMTALDLLRRELDGIESGSYF